MKYLDVPWEHKEFAKRMGAKWDPKEKRWYVPDGVDPAPFERWAPKPAPESVGIASPFALRAERFALLSGEVACWKCHASTPVSAIFLDEYSEADDESEERIESSEQAVVHGIVGLNPEVAQIIKQQAPWMRPGFSKTRDEVYLAPHCQHCDALQGAWFLSEPGGPFFPQSAQEAASLSVVWFDIPIEVDGEPSWSSWTDWLPRK